MVQLLFVNDIPDENTRSQECRSHTARFGHRHRRRQKANIFHNHFAPASRPLDDPKVAHESSTDSSGWTSSTASNRAILSPISTTRLRCPLILGPEAAPAAVRDGHECINFFISRARSKCSFLYPVFNMSSIHSLDWGRFVTNRYLYHAGAAFMHSVCYQASPLNKIVLRHRGKALKAIRKHLSTVGGDELGVDPHAIAAVAMLSVLDEKFGDTTSHKMHRKVIGVLMSFRSSRQNRHYHPLYSIISEQEMDCASRTGYSVLKYQPPSHQKTMLTKQYSLDHQNEFNALPQGFHTLISTGADISIETIDVIVNIARALQRGGPQTAEEEQYPEQDPLRQDYFQVFPYMHPDYPDELTFDNLLELALLLFCSHTLAIQDSGIGIMHVSKRMLAGHLPMFLSSQRQQPPSKSSRTETETLLWICILTLYAWKNSRENSLNNQATWLLLGLPLELLTSLDEDKMEELLRGYFWTDDFLLFGRERWKSINRPLDST